MKPQEISTGVSVYQGDALEVLRTLPSESVNCVVTSPPYWGLRDYGTVGQMGLESTPEEYVRKMVEVFREVRRVVRSDGTLWLNLGDSYTSTGGHSDANCNQRRGAYNIGRRPEHEKRHFRAGADCDPKRGSAAIGQPIRQTTGTGLKAKDLVGIPWMVAFALRSDGWFLRQDIIWSKPNPMPESVTDRCTKSHEYIFLMSKRERYHFNQDAILEPCSPATHARLSQDVQSQIGSERAHAGGKTNGSMKAVGRTPGSYKGSVPGRNGGPGQDRRSSNDRRPKAWDVDMGSNRTLVSGYGRKLAEAGSGTKNNNSFDAAMAIMPENRNRRSVWSVPTQSFAEAHFATFPEELIKPCILAGCPPQGTVLDPFFGSGTTGLVAQANGCKCIGIELNPDYIEIAKRRLSQEVLNFG